MSMDLWMIRNFHRVESRAFPPNVEVLYLELYDCAKLHGLDECLDEEEKLTDLLERGDLKTTLREMRVPSRLIDLSYEEYLEPSFQRKWKINRKAFANSHIFKNGNVALRYMKPKEIRE